MITGGTSGIGFAIARRLMEEGADVALVSERSDEQINQASIRTLSTAAGRVAGYRCDVRHRADTKSTAEKVVVGVWPHRYSDKQRRYLHSGRHV